MFKLNTQQTYPLLIFVLFTVSLSLQAASEPRIVGGILAPDGAYPFLTAIEDSRDDFQFCGGSLITPTKVITGAHCIDNTPMQIRIGTNNKRQHPGQVIRISKKVIHPKYDDFTIDYDIAVLTLAKPVKLSDTANIINLPEACASLTCTTGLAKPKTVLRIAGWGATAPNGGNSSISLREVDVPVVTNAVCNDAVGDITSRMMCAGYVKGGKDSCQGDSGGPLFAYVPSSNTGIQAGIVSWGIGKCGKAGLYGVYTRISHPEIRNFIRQEAGI